MAVELPLASKFTTALLLAATLFMLPSCLKKEEVNVEKKEVDHSHHDATPSKLTLDHGKKWPTDKVLRKNMSAMQALITNNKDKIHSGKFTEKEFKILAEKMDQAIGEIYVNCKLTPAADAQLHIILIDLVKGKKAITTPGEKRSEGLGLIHGALENYEKYFDLKM